jgi:dCTP deaminase
MSQLSAQSIRRLCQADPPLITPFVGEKTVVNGKSYGLSACSYDVRIAHKLCLLSGQSALAHTVEDFHLPDDVVGYVIDKSTWARRHVTAFNTLLDPGWHGNLTLELVNLGVTPVEIAAGDPICQIAFHWLDEASELPYQGKYQAQTKAAHGPRHEHDDGSWAG